MPNHEWLKNLAQTCFHPAPAINPKGRSHEQFLRSLEALYQESLEACEVFNQYAPKDRRITSHRLGQEPGGESGFMLLFGELRATCRLLKAKHLISCELFEVKGFREQPKGRILFQGVSDSYGSLRFRNQEGLLLDLELVLQQIFELMIRAKGDDRK